MTRDEALTACEGPNRASYMPSIVKIESKSEQKQIENYLFKRLGITENVWIGAKRDEDSSNFEWEDESELHYENWDKNRPSSDRNSNCAQIRADSGKWTDIGCDGRGIVICEKLQMWTFPELLNEFFEWRRHMERSKEELIENLIVKDIRITRLENSLDQISKRLSSLRTDFDDFSSGFVSHYNQTIERLVQQNSQLNRSVSGLYDKTDRLGDGLLALHDECSQGCSGDGQSNEGPTDDQLEDLKKDILREVDSKLDPIRDQLEKTVTDARLEIISYRRTLQIKKKGKWISLGHV